LPLSTIKSTRLSPLETPCTMRNRNWTAQKYLTFPPPTSFGKNSFDDPVRHHRNPRRSTVLPAWKCLHLDHLFSRMTSSGQTIITSLSRWIGCHRIVNMTVILHVLSARYWSGNIIGPGNAIWVAGGLPLHLYCTGTPCLHVVRGSELSRWASCKIWEIILKEDQIAHHRTVFLNAGVKDL